MSFVKGVRFCAPKSRAASIFGNSIPTHEAPAAAPKQKARPVRWEDMLQVAVVRWNRYYALPLKAMVWASLEGVVLDTVAPSKRTPQQKGRVAALDKSLRDAG